jgi:rhamnosyltransferase
MAEGKKATEGPPVSSTTSTAPSDGVCAVLVTYNPDPGPLGAAIDAAVQQVDELLILDNGSGPAGRAAVELAVQQHGSSGPGTAKITVRNFGENRGLPAAFNEAIDFARAHQHRFLLLLDHDSILAPGVVPTLVREYARLSIQHRVGALEAVNVEPVVLPTDDFLEEYLRRRSSSVGDGTTEEFLATNSGMLIPLALVDRVGKFDESYFVDAVDFEFGLRLRSLGWAIYRVPSARILHRRGEPVEARLGRVRWRLRRVAPQRHYYVGRDTLRLSGKYSRKFPLVGLFLLSMPFREAALVALFYPEKRTHLRALGLGMLHALTGVRGPYPGGG